MAEVHDKERKLATRSRRPSSAIPGVEVLALELAGTERFVVFVDHPKASTTLRERVTAVVAVPARYAVDVSSPGTERPAPQARALRARGRPAGRAAHRRRDRRPQALPRRARRGQPGGLKLAPEGAQTVEIPYDAIVRGNLIDDGSRD